MHTLTSVLQDHSLNQVVNEARDFSFFWVVVGIDPPEWMHIIGNGEQ